MAILGFFGALFRLVMVSELLEQSFDVSTGIHGDPRGSTGIHGDPRGIHGDPRYKATLFRTFLLFRSGQEIYVFMMFTNFWGTPMTLHYILKVLDTKNHVSGVCGAEFPLLKAISRSEKGKKAQKWPSK